MNETVSILRFCPKCGSASIEFRAIGLVLAGGPDATPAKCCACGWTGTGGELLASPIQHGQGSDEDLLEKWQTELRSLYAEHLGGPFAKFLARWGFLPALPEGATPAEMKTATLLFARYTAAMGAASAQAILEVRREVEAERVRASMGGGYDA